VQAATTQAAAPPRARSTVRAAKLQVADRICGHRRTPPVRCPVRPTPKALTDVIWYGFPQAVASVCTQLDSIGSSNV
jgi:hypothetical protein